ncbi:hypothetical protein [uncultured Luteimonas sp.]|uniref:hypothetical protein n=1 Tax=uncultured Luteimonas sp. TaxID=453144 RepID=UPI002612F7B3|nr:hypothetical protein [uncultured Luteimonas sp.]
MTHKRVQFDFELEFTNGGGLQGQGFRLDIDGDDIDDAALAEYIVRDLRLLMAGPVRITRKAIIAEAHKRVASPAPHLCGIVELSHVVRDGTVPIPACRPRASATTSAARPRARTTQKAPSSRSRASTWSPTPAPTWTVRFTATPTAPTWRRCRPPRSRTSTRW